jgi:hypothetical protein
MKTNTPSQTTTTTPPLSTDEKSAVVKRIQAIINKFGSSDMRQYYSGLLTFILCSTSPNMLNILSEFSHKLEQIYRSTNF